MKKSRLKGCFCSKAGFTLIEILIVVLIIGILAAIAVPQYQKAVEKNRAMQLLVSIKTLADAEEIYYMEHGSYTTYFIKLDIGYSFNAETMTLNDGSQIFLGQAHSRVYGMTKHVKISIFTKHGLGQAGTLHKPGMMICSARTADPIGTQVCKSLSGGVVVQPSYDCRLGGACTSYLLHR